MEHQHVVGVCQENPQMQQIGVGDNDKENCCLSVSFHEFKTHVPQQKNVAKDRNLSVHDSRKATLVLLQEKPKYFVVVDATELAEANTVLPLLDIQNNQRGKVVLE